MKVICRASVDILSVTSYDSKYLGGEQIGNDKRGNPLIEGRKLGWASPIFKNSNLGSMSK